MMRGFWWVVLILDANGMVLFVLVDEGAEQLSSVGVCRNA